MKKTNIDSPFYRTMGKIGDLLFANLLWLVCCLPIITAGASTPGLFTVVNKMAAKEDYTVRTESVFTLHTSCQLAVEPGGCGQMPAKI